MYGMGTSDCVALNLGESLVYSRNDGKQFLLLSHVVEIPTLLSLTLLQVVQFCAGFENTFGGEEKEIAKKRRKRPLSSFLIDTILLTLLSLFLLPHLAGSGTPYLDGYSRGALLGLTLGQARGSSQGYFRKSYL